MKKKAKGNFTVECALIMPIILLVIVSVIWIMIAMYDKGIMYKAAVHAILAADYHVSDNNFQLKKEIEERIYEESDGQLVGTDEPEISVNILGNKVNIKMNAALNVPSDIAGISELDNISVGVSKKRWFGADIISDVRRIKALYDLAEELSQKD
ncbi:MAG: pilus assembly protein [Lachnospiraceae bacterium]|nr:pilus assembly protein [Lachnospiraceae bacterium]